MVTQEAELNELRATIELLRQQGHAQLTPLRRPTLTAYTPRKDVLSNGQLSRIVIVCRVLVIVVLFLQVIYLYCLLRYYAALL